MKKISIIVPIFNEKDTLLTILKRIEEADTLGLEKEIILVDDDSKDGTREILKNIEGKHIVVYHQKNQGKGAALRTGFKKATGDIVLIQDADLEYNPQNYPQLLRPVLENKTDIVYGSRYLKKDNEKIHSKYYFGGKITNWILNLFYGSHFTDFWTCYKVFKAPIIKSFELESNGFDIEEEMTIKALKKNYKIIEVPIDYSPRTVQQGKKIKPKDGLILIWKVIKYKFVL
ncbi:MAG: glycosyltransferase family 2 protein [Candidatus Nealsonbacteria bacterium]